MAYDRSWLNDLKMEDVTEIGGDFLFVATVIGLPKAFKLWRKYQKTAVYFSGDVYSKLVRFHSKNYPPKTNIEDDITFDDAKAMGGLFFELAVTIGIKDTIKLWRQANQTNVYISSEVISKCQEIWIAKYMTNEKPRDVALELGCSERWVMQLRTQQFRIKSPGKSDQQLSLF